ncbi:Gfo/Idh/MocA family oxidoreductase [Pseudomonas sp. A2]|uniref:Gfo/Idh/MocA family protein n=1 Tax=Pseudomonas sp. A2 TaxID=107445 RepID=UPI002ACCAE92|nr:Gfo/Idh/MocA family oxidoreductase [Pseudomonas sp. A2]MEB3440346.1 Gfo/Idh/MocA family oxidoreductase [Pseudomonas sp. A2]HEN8736044.1 Gfo/Idh/MocA family oxidoreductase [Pseudomonas putida]
MTPLARRLRLGMVGGGDGAFIGAVHRMAARLDDRFEWVAGALSRDPARAAASARALFIAPERSYPNWETMARAEAARDDGIDAVVIVTPNHLHMPVASAFIAQGIDVICEKPLARTYAEAYSLAEKVRASDRIFAVTHPYSGYPMVREARRLVAAGAIGEVRVAQVEYAQEWLTELASSPQAAWRDDPEQAGPAGALGDIGSHALHLLEFVSGLALSEVCADIASMVPGRRLDDQVQAMLRFESGARGGLWACQVALGQDNGLRLRLFGNKGSLVFDQQQPEELLLTQAGQPTQILKRGAGEHAQQREALLRVPAGHPEGFIEAFAQLYWDYAERWTARETGGSAPYASTLLPGFEAGLRGLAAIEAMLRSHALGSQWVKLNY